MLKKLYNNTTIFLNIDEVKVSFKATCGVKQGDNFAPILFVIFLNAVTELLEKNWYSNALTFDSFKIQKVRIRQEHNLQASHGKIREKSSLSSPVITSKM